MYRYVISDLVHHPILIFAINSSNSSNSLSYDLPGKTHESNSFEFLRILQTSYKYISPNLVSFFMEQTSGSGSCIEWSEYPRNIDEARVNQFGKRMDTPRRRMVGEGIEGRNGSSVTWLRKGGNS